MTLPTINSPKGDVRLMIEQIVLSLVEESGQVSVTQVEESGDTMLELKVAPRDVGKVIGKQGRTVRAMRNVLSAVGARSNQRFALDIIEDEINPAEGANI